MQPSKVAFQTELSKGEERIKENKLMNGFGYGAQDPCVFVCLFFYGGDGQKSVKFRGNNPAKQ